MLRAATSPVPQNPAKAKLRFRGNHCLFSAPAIVPAQSATCDVSGHQVEECACPLPLARASPGTGIFRTRAVLSALNPSINTKSPLIPIPSLMASRCPRSLPRASALAASGAPGSHRRAWGALLAVSRSRAAAAAPAVALGADLSHTAGATAWGSLPGRTSRGAEATYEALVVPRYTLGPPLRGVQCRGRAGQQQGWSPARAWAAGTPAASPGRHLLVSSPWDCPWDFLSREGVGQESHAFSAHRGSPAGAQGRAPGLRCPSAVSSSSTGTSTSTGTSSVNGRRSSSSSGSRGRGGRGGGGRGGRGGGGRGVGGRRGGERGRWEGSGGGRGEGEQRGRGAQRSEGQAGREATTRYTEGTAGAEPRSGAREGAQESGERADATAGALPGANAPSPSSPSRSAREGVIARAAREQDVPRVHLKRGKAGLFRSGGSPFVFGGAVDCVVGRPPPGAGDSVALADGEGAVFAWGVFNPHSMYRVRVMQTEADAARFPSLVLNMPALIAHRLRAAADLRSRIGLTVSAPFPLPEAHRTPQGTPVDPVPGSGNEREEGGSSLEGPEARLDTAGAAGDTVGQVHGMQMGQRQTECVPVVDSVGGAAGEGGSGATALAVPGGWGAASGTPAPPDSGATTVFRLVNSEGDRLSGLVVDVFGGRAVVSSSAAWAEAYRGHITTCLCDLMRPQAPPPRLPATATRPFAPGTPVAPVAPGAPGAHRGHDEQGLVVWRPSVEMLKEEGWGVGGETIQEKDAEEAAAHAGLPGLSTHPPPNAELGLGDTGASRAGSSAQEEAWDGALEPAADEAQALVRPGSTAESSPLDFAEEALPGRRAPAGSSSEEGTPEEGLRVPATESAGSEEDSGVVEVVEHGLRFSVDLRGGQKTGFYADQRDSRLLIRQAVAAQCQAVASKGNADAWAQAPENDSRRLTSGGSPSDTPSAGVGHLDAAGVRVLDLCCYTGGFALSAAAGGALLSVGVDSSASALALAERNRERNGISPHRCRFVKADILEFMAASLARGEQWDVVILDPPKLAPSRKSLARALPRYRRLNAAALRLLAPGGLLMTCSCSGAVTQAGAFLPVLQEAAVAAQRRVTVLRTAGPGMDHPLDPACPEGAYLTNVLLRVE